MKKTVNIVKIGSDSITEKNLEKMVSDMKKWSDITGELFIVISSGAVKYGKITLVEEGKNIDNFTKASFASIGWTYLKSLYTKLFKQSIGGLLIDDFADKKHLASTIKNLLENNIPIIINHNDALHNNELKQVSKKADNDKNTVFITKILHKYYSDWLLIKRVIYLTNTNGLLDKNKKTVSGGKIKSKKDELKYLGYVYDSKSSSGTGGMESKLKCSFKVLKHGAEVAIIANAKHGLYDCLQQTSKKCTYFEKN